MHTEYHPRQRRARGYALALTLIFIALSLVVLAGLGKWTAGSAVITARNNAFSSTVSAAEAATEVVIAQMNRDFLHQSPLSDLSPYQKAQPANFVADAWAGDYQFSDGLGNQNQSDVVASGWLRSTNIDAKYPGLYGMVNTVQVTSNAKRLTGQFPVAAGVQQTFQLATIPIFQFAIFYNMDLEINPAPPMIVTGKVHANGNIYVAPQNSLEFVDTVSATGQIYHDRSPNDPTVARQADPTYDSSRLEGVSALTLPIGVDNSPENIIQILDIPPYTEDANSEMGRQRYYNKSDLIVITTAGKVTVKYNDFERGLNFVDVPTNTVNGSGYTFVNTNASFFDYREGSGFKGMQVLATEIDVAALNAWMLSDDGIDFNDRCVGQTTHIINSIYVADHRSVADQFTAVRVANGRYLPAAGLTVATARPLYVLGHFNAPDLTVGSTDTSNTRPSSLVADAITILSSAWTDSYPAAPVAGSARVAADTTVNAAIISGIVPSVTVTGRGHYSGGAENLMRFLEDWGALPLLPAKTLTYNGSLVVMFPSRYATGYWAGSGAYYSPPARQWAFDENFLDPNKLPPGTPQVRKLLRGQWTVVAAANN